MQAESHLSLTWRYDKAGFGKLSIRIMRLSGKLCYKCGKLCHNCVINYVINATEWEIVSLGHCEATVKEL